MPPDFQQCGCLINFAAIVCPWYVAERRNSVLAAADTLTCRLCAHPLGLVLNSKTAAALGLTNPPSVRLNSNHVIQ
jgi:hypothetical protein